jgi:glycerol-3-phosphate acyltransferase PlsY
MAIYDFLLVPLGYLLGSIPSAYIIGRLAKGVDVRTEADGRISAAAVYRRAGVIPFLAVIAMDVGQGAAAILIAKFLTDSLLVILLAGLAAVVGHNWSVFLKFRGGLGATTTYGVLAGLAIWQLLIAGLVAVVPFVVTRKSGLSTGVLIGTISIIFLVQRIFFDQEISVFLIVYPPMLIACMLLKRFQIRRPVSNSI